MNKKKLLRRLTHFLLRPIQVFVFHQVSDTFDPTTMWKCDWTETTQFKNNILKLKQKYEFIPLTEAYTHLKKDWFRRKKFAVLTCDDGYASLKNILPWLEKEKIPTTLFINSKYLDGQSWSPLNEELIQKYGANLDMRDVVKGLYLTKEELRSLASPYFRIGLHGHEHLSAISMSNDMFKNNVILCKSELESHPRYIPYYAYTWGQHNSDTDNILDDFGLIKITVNGQKNHSYNGFIDRKCIDGLKI